MYVYVNDQLLSCVQYFWLLFIRRQVVVVELTFCEFKTENFTGDTEKFIKYECRSLSLDFYVWIGGLKNFSWILRAASIDYSVLFLPETENLIFASFKNSRGFNFITGKYSSKSSNNLHFELPYLIFQIHMLSSSKVWWEGTGNEREKIRPSLFL